MGHRNLPYPTMHCENKTCCYWQGACTLVLLLTRYCAWLWNDQSFNWLFDWLKIILMIFCIIYQAQTVLFCCFFRTLNNRINIWVWSYWLEKHLKETCCQIKSSFKNLIETIKLMVIPISTARYYHWWMQKFFYSSGLIILFSVAKGVLRVARMWFSAAVYHFWFHTANRGQTIMRIFFHSIN